MSSARVCRAANPGGSLSPQTQPTAGRNASGAESKTSLHSFGGFPIFPVQQQNGRKGKDFLNITLFPSSEKQKQALSGFAA